MNIELYDNPVQMEPLTIDSHRPVYIDLIGQMHELSEASASLQAKIAPQTAEALSELVAGMNCYYSNLIEGHHIRPLDIERAMKREFPAEKDEQSRMQHLAFGHIQAECWAQGQCLSTDTLERVLQEVHRIFVENLPLDMLRLEDGSMLEPGVFRHKDVAVGTHAAPSARHLQAFIARFAQRYGQMLEGAGRSPAQKLHAMLSTIISHHRLAWIHPFLDGNGRVARIVLDAMMRQIGVNQFGLWSFSRGLAKSAEQYKTALAGADQPRHGALDGRGNLSERKLAEFCRYMATTAIDQARYMAQMFDLPLLERRCQHYFRNVRGMPGDLKPESANLYLHAMTQGEFDRMEAGLITGLPERTARDVLRAMLDEGFLRSDSPRGSIKVAFPVHALGTLFPNLYPAGDLDVEIAPTSRLRRRL